MKCPYCHEEMQRGLLQSARDIFWGTKKHKLSFMPRGDEEFMLSGPASQSLSGATVAAWHCPDCKKIIVDINET